MLFSPEGAAEFNCWPKGLTPLFSNKLTAHGSGCQDVAIMNLPLPLPSHTLSPLPERCSCGFRCLIQKNNWRCCRTLLIWQSGQQNRRCSNVRCLMTRSQESGTKMEWRSCQAIVSEWLTLEGTRTYELIQKHLKVISHNWASSTFCVYLNAYFMRQMFYPTWCLLLLVSGFIGCSLMTWSQRMLETTHLFLMDTLCHFLPSSTSWVRKTEWFQRCYHRCINHEQLAWYCKLFFFSQYRN